MARRPDVRQKAAPSDTSHSAVLIVAGDGLSSARRPGFSSLQKTWSPPSRAPRFSRFPSARLRVRVAAVSCPAATVGVVGVWASRILLAKARKSPFFKPERAQLLSLLE